MKENTAVRHDFDPHRPVPPRRRPTAASLLLALAVTACAQSHHPVIPASLGSAPVHSTHAPTASRVAWQRILAQLDQPGPIELVQHVAADWSVPLEGLLNLAHPKARRAGLENRLEPIQIYFYTVRHPKHGHYWIDSGVARSIARRDANMPLHWPVTAAMNLESLRVHEDTRQYLDSSAHAVQGVWLTHLHLDHILGLQDIPKDTPLFTGPSETEDQRLVHMASRATTDANLEGFGPLRQWSLLAAPELPFEFVDVFGDQSVVGLHVPGHTRGSMAFVVRTTTGPQLITGDACHTAWGWNHAVEPGTFNTDGNQAAASLQALRRLAAEHPSMRVHLGHQTLRSAAVGGNH